jgi:ferritin-like metal-binding protein YciE
LIAWADELGRDDVVRLLTTNLNEEKAARQEVVERRIAEGRESQSRELIETPGTGAEIAIFVACR